MVSVTVYKGARNALGARWRVGAMGLAIGGYVGGVGQFLRDVWQMPGRPVVWGLVGVGVAALLVGALVAVLVVGRIGKARRGFPVEEGRP